jgi:hypothetical protein
MSTTDSDDVLSSIIDDYLISEEEIINFVYKYDDKKTPLKDLDNKIVDNLIDELDVAKMETFYLNHLDLFISNQHKFKVLKNGQFLEKYMKYRQAFAEIKTYFDSLKLNLKLTSSPITPTLPSNDVFVKGSPVSTTSSTSSKNSKFRISDLFQKHPSESIFSKIEPSNFARISHKMYVFYYFLIEMRQYQYVSRTPNRNLEGFAMQFGNFYDNLYKKLESVIEIYCNNNNFNLLSDIFIELTNEYLNLGNTTLAQICLNLMNRFKICKKRKIKEFLDNLNDIKTYKKYTYLVDSVSIMRAFISAQEIDNKIKTFAFIQKKMITTRDEILKSNVISMKSTYEDFLVYNFIQPENIIKEKLYRTSTGGVDFQCIIDKCKKEDVQEGGFDKSHTKFPRRMSKEYCMKTPCKHMGFSQKASCRYYKNCYK